MISLYRGFLYLYMGNRLHGSHLVIIELQWWKYDNIWVERKEKFMTEVVLISQLAEIVFLYN